MIWSLGVKDGRGLGYKPIIFMDIVKDSLSLETLMMTRRKEDKARQMATVSIQLKRDNEYADPIRGTFSGFATVD